MVSDAAGDVGEVEPDLDAAEVRAFGADGRSNTGAEIAGRADVPSDFGMDFAELSDFVHRSLKDFFLSVEASAHGPFVEKMEERAGFIEANGFGVGENVKSDFERDAAVEELILGAPGVMHGAVVSFLGARVGSKQRGHDVIGISRVGERE